MRISMLGRLGGCFLALTAWLGCGPPRVQPTLVTLLGGDGGKRVDSQAQTCAVGPDGSLYMAGATSSPDFPVTPGAFQTVHHPGPSDLDGFVAKLSPDGRKLLWSTLLGGGHRDNVMDMTVDAEGNVFLTGITRSEDFPVTPGAYERRGHAPDYGSDVFVTKLAPDGSHLVWSAVIGDAGETTTRGNIVLDDAGRPWLVGDAGAPDFPTTPDAFQPVHAGGDLEVVLFSLEADGSRLHYSTFLGGSRSEMGFGLARGRDGTFTAAGWTRSPDFPVTTGAFQTRYGGDDGTGTWGGDVWVARFSPDGRRLVWSTFYGGPGNDASSGNQPLALDPEGRPVVVGEAGAAGVPTTEGAWHREPFPGARNGFTIVLKADGSGLAAGTLTGTAARLEVGALVVDGQGRIYHGGRASSGFPTTDNAFQRSFGGGREDNILEVFAPDLSRRLYASYLGGSGDEQESTRCAVLTPSGTLWTVGDSGAPDFPTTSDAIQARVKGRTSAYGALWPPAIANPAR